MKKRTAIAAALLAASAFGASWDTGSWDLDTWQPAQNNVLRGLSPAQGSTLTSYPYSGEGTGGPERLTDGTMPTVQENSNSFRSNCYMIGNQNILVYELSEPRDIVEVRLFTIWCDNGRDYIRPYGVDYKTASSDWTEISGSRLTAYQNDTYRNRAYLSNGNGTAMAENVTALRIRFGTQENDFCGYSEIEAVALPKAEPVGEVTVAECGQTSATLTATALSLGSGASSADLYFAYGTDASSLVPAKYGTSLTAAGQTISIPLTGLSQNTEYTYKYYFTNNTDKASAEQSGTFTTGGAVSFVNDEDLVVERSSLAELAANETASIKKIYDNGSIVLDSGSTLNFQLTSYIATNAGESASLVVRNGAKMKSTSSNGEFFVGFRGGHGTVVVEEGGELDLGKGVLQMAGNGGSEYVNAGSHANLEIHGMFKCLRAQGCGWWPGSSAPSSNKLNYPLASEVTVYTNGCFETAQLNMYDYARCDLTLAGGTLRITAATEQFFGGEGKPVPVLTLREGTTNIIDVGSNNVTLRHNNMYFTGAGTLVKKGSGTLTIYGGSNDSFAGNIVVEEGALSLSRALSENQRVLVKDGADYALFSSSDEDKVTFEGGHGKTRLDVISDLPDGYDLANSMMFLDTELGGPSGGTATIGGTVTHGTVSQADPFKLHGNGGTLVMNNTGLDSVPLLLEGEGTFKFGGDRTIASQGDIAFAADSKVVYEQVGKISYAGFAWNYPVKQLHFGGLDIGAGASFVSAPGESSATAYRYYKLAVDATTSGGMQMSEFEMYCGSEKIAVRPEMGSCYNRPSGTGGEAAGNTLDGNQDSKMYDGNVNDGNCWLQIDLGENNAQPVTSYRWMTGNDNHKWGGRNPTAWRFLGSNDGGNWTLLDQHAGMPEMNVSFTWTEKYVFVFGTSDLIDGKPVTVAQGGSLVIHGLASPSSVTGAGSVTLSGADSVLRLTGASSPEMTGGITGGGSLEKTGAAAIYARGTNSYAGDTVISNGSFIVYGGGQAIKYYKLVITDAGDNNDHCTQLTRFALFDADGVDQALGLTMKGVGTDATQLAAGEFYRALDYKSYNNSPEKLFRDNDDKWCWGNANGGPGNDNDGDGTITLILRLSDNAHEVVSYNFRTAGDDASHPPRSLRAWTLYGSEDGTNWVVLDERSDFPNVGKNNTWYNGGAAFPCRFYAGRDATDRTIPAGSIVEVASGAQLGVYTAMTLSALRIPAAPEGANPVVDGLNMTGSGALYLVGDPDPALCDRWNVPINLKNLGATRPWSVYLNGNRTSYTFRAAEGDGTSYLVKSGFAVIVR